MSKHVESNADSAHAPGDPSRKGVIATLRNKLFAGVAVAIPLVVTLWVLNLAYVFIKGISSPVLARIVLRSPAPGVEKLTLSDLPGVGFVVTILMLVLMGFMATNVFGRRLIEWMERMLLRVPVVATIYGAVKQVMDSIKSFSGGMSFKRVVYIEYPSDGCMLIGFVTGQYLDPKSGIPMTSVFIPTAPNPMTGFVIIVATDKLIESDLGIDDASKMIISGGLIGPRPPGMPADSVQIQGNGVASAGQAL